PPDAQLLPPAIDGPGIRLARHADVPDQSAGSQVPWQRSAGDVLPARAGAHTNLAGSYGGRCRADIPAGWRRLHSLVRASGQAAAAAWGPPERHVLRCYAGLLARAEHSHQVGPR